ncbi:MAG: Nramp family divalent metal transporter [Ignavibacteriales bacterium]|nr:Nramp family divalent metal transporter [Ignavibacteriales bacterium]
MNETATISFPRIAENFSEQKGIKKIFNRNLIRALGPAFLVSVGYMDPGNWATDIEGGSRFGYALLWVIFLSNMMAILLQTLSAKLGIATGKDLAQNCRTHYSRSTSFFLWFTAELAMIATDLAEFLGSALAIYLLFHIDMFTAVLITGFDVLLILALQRYGFRPLEYAIITFVATIGLCYVVELFFASPNWSIIPYHVVVPQISSESILVAIGILGATVMPHNLYLHSNIIQSRLSENPSNEEKHKVFRFAKIDSIIALNGAWFVNSAILIMAAGAFYTRNMEVVSIEEAHKTLEILFGGMSAFVFALALLASGISSSVTGTMAGQIVMEGFLDIKIRPWLRRLILRLIVMIPAMIAVGIGTNPLELLVLSQVFLSFQLPFAIIPLIKFTKDKTMMGELANKEWITYLAITCAVVIIGLNILLLFKTFGGEFAF